MVSQCSNRDRAVAAAIDLLGTQGIRGLTHARVDDAAGMPRGSTSNVFRSKAELLAGAVDGILAGDLAAVTGGFGASSADELVELLCGMLDMLTGPGRTATAARLALFMEGSHDPDLRAALSAGRDQLIGLTQGELTRLGAADPAAAAELLATVMEGLILHRVCRHDTSDPRPVLAIAIRGALGK